MLTPDGLFFAPGIRFKDLNVNSAQALADALAARAQDWFFGPAWNVAASSALRVRNRRCVLYRRGGRVRWNDTS